MVKRVGNNVEFTDCWECINCDNGYCWLYERPIENVKNAENCSNWEGSEEEARE